MNVNKIFEVTESNVGEYADKIGTWISDYIKESNRKGVVLGMSGGIDCSTVAMLCKHAGVDVHLVIMPFGDSMINDGSMNRAKEIIDKNQFKYHTFNIKNSFDTFLFWSRPNLDKKLVDLSRANIKVRCRMTYLYQVAQVESCCVIGTGNLSERYTGYCTKWGDAACDLNPLGLLTKGEVYILARYLGVPDSIINAAPSAGLWAGQEDEKEMGFSYKQLDDYIINGTSGSEEADKLIWNRHVMSQHKINPVPMFNNFINPFVC
jgi:NAD+ synthase